MPFQLTWGDPSRKDTAPATPANDGVTCVCRDPSTRISHIIARMSSGSCENLQKIRVAEKRVTLGHGPAPRSLFHADRHPIANRHQRRKELPRLIKPLV